ncbi:hypothetical protein [Sedimenticola selenatireducens]|uniref:Uncharacterized protein n=1 Tax=Sedimenticola selenatireducens TaxID=191960 RepID=A0A2N6CS86_9GAMM|nr:hypothetical protein [Sedimenticola selenatireducens]PLX59915.1 MAG: hypothetical protein C0630_18625 [Sedimenticola selenatireducens]
MKSVLVYSFVIIALGLLSGVTNADVLVATLDDPNKEGLKESYTDDVPVSGRVVAGVMLMGMANSGNMVIYPSGVEAGSRVCVQVTSRDGRYWAENNFLLPSNTADDEQPKINEPVSLQYDTEYEDELKGFKLDELAILSYTHDCDHSRENSYFPATRNGFSGEKKRLRIYINSGRADSYVRVENPIEGNNKSRMCRRFTEGRRTGYDTVCEIPWSSNLTLKPLKVDIYRRKYDKNLPKESFVIHLPGSSK